MFADSSITFYHQEIWVETNYCCRLALRILIGLNPGVPPGSVQGPGGSICKSFCCTSVLFDNEDTNKNMTS